MAAVYLREEERLSSISVEVLCLLVRVIRTLPLSHLHLLLLLLRSRTRLSIKEEGEEESIEEEEEAVEEEAVTILNLQKNLRRRER